MLLADMPGDHIKGQCFIVSYSHFLPLLALADSFAGQAFLFSARRAWPPQITGAPVPDHEAKCQGETESKCQAFPIRGPKRYFIAGLVTPASALIAHAGFNARRGPD